jgi:HSP20 family protein
MTRVRYRRRHGRCATTEGEGGATAVEWWQLSRTVVIAAGAWRPRADVYESSGQILVAVELAGVEPRDLEVQLYDDMLLVEGRRSIPEALAEGRYHSAEIPRGRFRLRLRLPALVDSGGAEARFERGLLELSLPKAGGAR